MLKSFLCSFKETPIQTQEPESATSYWVMVALTGLLGFYSMLVTAVFIIYRVRNYYPLLYVLCPHVLFISHAILPILTTNPLISLALGSQCFFSPATYSYLCYAPRKLKYQMLSR